MWPMGGPTRSPGTDILLLKWPKSPSSTAAWDQLGCDRIVLQIIQKGRPHDGHGKS